jgi:hypothetical protein
MKNHLGVGKIHIVKIRSLNNKRENSKKKEKEYREKNLSTIKILLITILTNHDIVIMI